MHHAWITSTVERGVIDDHETRGDHATAAPSSPSLGAMSAGSPSPVSPSTSHPPRLTSPLSTTHSPASTVVLAPGANAPRCASAPVYIGGLGNDDAKDCACGPGSRRAHRADSAGDRFCTSIVTGSTRDLDVSAWGCSKTYPLPKSCSTRPALADGTRARTTIGSSSTAYTPSTTESTNARRSRPVSSYIVRLAAPDCDSISRRRPSTMLKRGAGSRPCTAA